MDFFSKVGDTLKTATSEVSGKAKDMTTTAQLQYEMKVKEDFKKTQYEEIGRRYYEANKEEAPEDMKELFDEIAEADARIEAIKAEISTIKGEAHCPKCGAVAPAGSVFCSECGAKINETEEE